MFGIRCADKREIRFIGDGKDDPAIGALKEIALVMVEQLFGYDMTAAHQTHPSRTVAFQRTAQHIPNPRSGRIHHHPGRVLRCLARGRVLGFYGPDSVGHIGRQHLFACRNPCAPLLSITRIQHHKPRILDPAIRILERFFELAVQRRPFRRRRQIQTDGAWQDLAPTKVVIQEQTQPNKPGRATALHPRHDGAEQFGRRRGGIKPHVPVIGQHKPHGP